MTKTIHLIWDDCALTIAPSFEALEQFLTITEKRLESDPKKPWIKRTKFVKSEIFQTLTSTSNHNVIQTYQGLWLEVKEFCESLGYRVVIHDKRTPIPKANLEAMQGMRFSQEPLLRKFLSADCSGLLGAPTRYGKTTLIKNTLKAYEGVTTVVTAPGEALFKQLYEDIKDALPHREVKLIGAGSRVRYPSEDITVCSMDSLHKCDTGLTRLLLIDEPHTAVTASRIGSINAFSKSRRLGFGATLTGRYDQRDRLITALIGPLLAEISYVEAVNEGAVAPLVVFMLKIPLEPTPGDRNAAHNRLLYLNDRMAGIVSKISREIIPADWQTLMFIKNEKQAEFYKSFIGEEGTIAMAKRLKPKDRDALQKLMVEDKVKRCLASDIYAQGVTFNHVRALFNLCGGGATTQTIQKPGRVVEVRPGKRNGVLFDFMFEPRENESYDNLPGCSALFRESKARIKAYKDKGYDVVEVEGFKELREEFTKRCL